MKFFLNLTFVGLKDDLDLPNDGHEVDLGPGGVDVSGAGRWDTRVVLCDG